MYDQIREDTLFIILYSVVTAMAMMASCYLLFRRANAIAPDVTPPARLRRWAAALFAAITFNHLWYMPMFFLTSSEDITMIDLWGGLLDCMIVFPLTIVVMFAMLQDRRRPLWPVAVMFAPLVVGSAMCVATRSYNFLPLLYLYSLLLCIGLIIYTIHATRQYGRWLRDNYADLEHKEVWQSFVVLAIILLVSAVYVFVGEGPAYQYAMQVMVVVLIYYLLWRVETLSDLSLLQPIQPLEEVLTNVEIPDENSLSQANYDYIGVLLKQYCIDTQLYLQHDLSLSQLAKAIGTNRLYLSQYFSSMDMNYNAYINDLRINHFISLYRDAVVAQCPVTAQQLALESGFRHYRTFSNAFKRKMGYTVTSWMKAAQREEQPRPEGSRSLNLE